MAHEPLSRIPKNRKKKMTENEMMEKFLNENTDILLKYMLWKEHIMEPQVLSADVKIEAEDVTHYESTLGAEGLKELFKDNGLTDINYGVIEPNPEDPTRV